MTAGELAARIGGARNVGAETWIACCPACESPYSGLTIRTARDGRVLTVCESRCSARAIVTALGLELADLFPPKPAQDRAA